MSEILQKLGKAVDSLTGQKDSLGHVLIIILVVLGYFATTAWMSSTNHIEKVQDEKAEEEEEIEPQRNFTATQLSYYDGKPDKDGELKPVYLSVQGTVFDVSQGRNFYGPDGPYEAFAGHECGVALAKMSFDEQYLDNLDGCDELNFGERTELEGWIDKFTHYRSYPIKGRLIPDNRMPSPDRIVPFDELSCNNGSGEVPKGYAAAPIYVGAGSKVFDMSFGGVTFYGPGGPYNKFAGHDVTRALALMSLSEEDINNPDISDITEKQTKTMNDWIKTFEERKQYPVVGRLEK